tara:strand:- start:971 stop:1282 length:312 start_codon:yes stop_codon:yes gene_type:complete
METITLISQYKLQQIFDNNGLDSYSSADSVRQDVVFIESMNYDRYDAFVVVNDKLTSYLAPWSCLIHDIIEEACDFKMIEVEHVTQTSCGTRIRKEKQYIQIQ